MIDMGWHDVKIDKLTLHNGKASEVMMTAKAFGSQCLINGVQWLRDSRKEIDWLFKVFSTTPIISDNVDEAIDISFQVFKCLEARKHLYDHANVKGFNGYKRSSGPLDGDTTYAFEVWHDTEGHDIWAHVVFNDGSDVDPESGEPFAVSYLVSAHPEGGSDPNEHKGWAGHNLDKLAELVKERIETAKRSSDESE